MINRTVAFLDSCETKDNEQAAKETAVILQDSHMLTKIGNVHFDCKGSEVPPFLPQDILQQSIEGAMFNI